MQPFHCTKSMRHGSASSPKAWRKIWRQMEPGRLSCMAWNMLCALRATSNDFCDFELSCLIQHLHCLGKRLNSTAMGSKCKIWLLVQPKSFSTCQIRAESRSAFGRVQMQISYALASLRPIFIKAHEIKTNQTVLVLQLQGKSGQSAEILTIAIFCSWASITAKFKPSILGPPPMLLMWNGTLKYKFQSETCPQSCKVGLNLFFYLMHRIWFGSMRRHFWVTSSQANAQIWYWVT